MPLFRLDVRARRFASIKNIQSCQRWRVGLAGFLVLYPWWMTAAPEQSWDARSRGGSELISTGRYAEAEALLRQVVSTLESKPATENAELAKALGKLAVAIQSQGRYAEAEQLCRQALLILEKALGPDHPD